MLHYLYYSVAIFVATLLIMTSVEFISKPDVGSDSIVLVFAYSAFNLWALLMSIGRHSLNYYNIYIFTIYFLLALGMSIITKFTFTRTLTIIQAIVLVIAIANAPYTKQNEINKLK